LSANAAKDTTNFLTRQWGKPSASSCLTAAWGTEKKRIKAESRLSGKYRLSIRFSRVFFLFTYSFQLP
jgi:hypothetical protein